MLSIQQLVDLANEIYDQKIEMTDNSLTGLSIKNQTLYDTLKSKTSDALYVASGVEVELGDGENDDVIVVGAYFVDTEAGIGINYRIYNSSIALCLSD